MALLAHRGRRSPSRIEFVEPGPARGWLDLVLYVGRISITVRQSASGRDEVCDHPPRLVQTLGQHELVGRLDERAECTCSGNESIDIGHGVSLVGVIGKSEERRRYRVST